MIKLRKRKNKITIEKNTEIFLEDFKKLVKNKNDEAVSDTVKFITNSIQCDLFTMCYYNNRNYKRYK